MTDTQFYLVIGIPILVNLVTTAIVILYIKIRIDRFKRSLTKKLTKYLDENFEDEE